MDETELSVEGARATNDAFTAVTRASAPEPFPPEAPSSFTPKTETVGSADTMKLEEGTAGYIRTVRLAIKEEIQQLQTEKKDTTFGYPPCQTMLVERVF